MTPTPTLTVSEVPVEAPAPAPAELPRRVIEGGLWSIGGQIATLLVSLVLTPFILRLLGTEAYGVLTLITTLSGYLVFTDLGMGTAATKFGSEAFAQQDSRREAEAIWTSLVLSTASTVLGALALAACAGWLVGPFLDVPEHLEGAAIVGIRLTCVAFVLRGVGAVLRAVEVIRLRFDLHALVNSGTNIVQTCLVLLVLALGGGVIQAAAMILAAAGLAALLHLLFAVRLQPGLRQLRMDPALVRPLVRFGWPLVISSLVGIVLFHGERLIVTKFVGVAGLAYYGVAFTVALLIDLVPAAFIQPLMPVFTQKYALSDHEALEQYYCGILRGTLFLLAPASLILALAARPFFTLWAGPDYGEHSVVPFYWLLAGAFINALAHVPRTFLAAVGKPAIIARVHLAETIPYVVIGSLATCYYGVVGAAATWSLRGMVECGITLIAARQVAGIPGTLVPRNAAPFLAAAALLIVPVLLTVGLTDSAALIAAAAVVSCLAYLFVLWRLLISAEERDWFRGWISGYLRKTV
jgi:O-antigen/teichoic acid export membrane protein